MARGGANVVGYKRRWRFRSEILGAVDQTRDYSESFTDPRNVAETRRVFFSEVLEPQRTVIAGALPANDRDKLHRAQKFLADVDVKPYNDVLDAAIRRFVE